jgi:hypothetical protein
MSNVLRAPGYGDTDTDGDAAGVAPGDLVEDGVPLGPGVELEVGEAPTGAGSTTSAGAAGAPTARAAASTANHEPAATPATRSNQARTTVTGRTKRTSTPPSLRGPP